MIVKTSKRQRDVTWRNSAAASVLKEAGSQTLGLYIDKWQATVAEWVTLRPILEVCNMDTGYKRWGRRRELWWRKTSAWNYLSATLEDILEGARAWCWESSRHGKGREDGKVADSDSGSEYRSVSWMTVKLY